jgi:hypothetical protein
MSRSTYLNLLCDYYRQLKSASDAVAWAVAELLEGHDSPSLRRLAALREPTDWSEAQPLLRASFEELGYEWLDEPSCYRETVTATARAILSGETDPSRGCIRMYELWEALGYPADLQAWGYLCDDLDPKSLGSISADQFPDRVKAEAAALLQHCEGK